MPSARVMPADLSRCRVRVGTLDGFAVAVTESGELILRLPTRSAEFRRRLKSWGCVVVAGRLPKVRAIRAHGSRFQLKVWQACQRIRPGQTATYGAIAKTVGCRSAQAVGTALGANPLAVLIPCHRVVSATGPGGFAWGLVRKRRWLQAERDGLAG
ncbi:MAG: MGMT family protein [Opitutales bacterium]|nr:MGMT family protein [Opitutales bacterium]